MTPQQSLINGFGVLFVILNAFGLGLRLPVGDLLAQAFAKWKIVVWALVVNFVVIPLLFVGYLLTIADSIPGEIKVGFCIAALCAGMPFAPVLAQLAKADVNTAVTMLVVLTAGTIIALPIGLPLAIDAVDVQLEVSAWDVAWPLLLFLLLPIVLGCGFRVWWSDLTGPLAQWTVRVAVLCLLFNVNFTLVAYWDLFVEEWGTESYIAALAGPFIGLGCGYLLVSGLRVRDVGVRHAAEATTAVRNIAPMLLMMIFPFGSDPLVTVSITILNTVGIVIVLVFVLMWRRAAPDGQAAIARRRGVVAVLSRGVSGALGVIRTPDTRFRKPMLYPLSYEGGDCDGCYVARSSILGPRSLVRRRVHLACEGHALEPDAQAALVRRSHDGASIVVTR